MYDLTNPQQAQAFRTQQLSKGINPAEVESFIMSTMKQQYDAKKMQGIGQTSTSGTDPNLEAENVMSGFSTIDRISEEGKGILRTKYNYDPKGPKTEPKASDYGEFDRKVFNARTTAIGAVKQLEEKIASGTEISGPITTRVQKMQEFFGKPTEGLKFRVYINTAAAQLFNALAGTAQSAPELERLQNLIPKDTEQEEVALQKLKTMLEISSEMLGLDNPTSDQSPSINLGGDQPQQMTPDDLVEYNKAMTPKLNLEGSVATDGDLIRGDDGSLQIYGTPKTKSYKQLSQEGRASGSLVKWLAESEFLPIAGSIAGSIAGAGLGPAGMIAVGAGAAGGGKALQEAIKEMRDPDNHTMGQAAKAVFLESITDAVFGGMGFAVGKVGSKLILGKAGKEVIEEGAEQASKRLSIPLLGTREDMLKEAIRIPGSVSEEMAKKGINFYDEAVNILDKGLGKVSGAEDIFDLARASKKDINKKITEVLYAKDVDLKPMKEGLERLLADTSSYGVETDFKTSVRKITKVIDKIDAARIKDIKGSGFLPTKIIGEYHGTSIPAQEANKLKKELGEAFKGMLEETGSKAITRNGYRVIMGQIEKAVPEVKDLNKKWAIANLLESLSAKKVDTETVKGALNAFDLAAGTMTAASGGLMPTAGYTGLRAMWRAIKNPYARLNAFNKLISIAKNKGNKSGARTIVKFMMDQGVEFDVADDLIKSAGVGLGTSVGASMNPTMPAPQPQPQPQPQPTPSLNLGGEQPPAQGGGGIGLSLPKYLYT